MSRGILSMMWLLVSLRRKSTSSNFLDGPKWCTNIPIRNIEFSTVGPKPYIPMSFGVLFVSPIIGSTWFIPTFLFPFSFKFRKPFSFPVPEFGTHFFKKHFNENSWCISLVMCYILWMKLYPSLTNHVRCTCTEGGSQLDRMLRPPLSILVH